MARLGSLLRIRICRLLHHYVQYALFGDGRLSRPRLLALLLTASAFIGLFLCWREISTISTWGTRWHVSDRVVAYLTSRNRLDQMGESMQKLFLNFNDRFRYPVLVFHRGDVPRWLAYYILSHFLRPDQLELIELHEAIGIRDFPPELDVDTLLREKIEFAHLWPNYQHMCAFWFHHIYLQPRIREGGVQYYMRLDTDSQIVAKVNYDLFEFMERTGTKYAFRLRWGENDCCAKQMVEFIYKYGEKYNLFKGISKEISWLSTLQPDSLTNNPDTLNPKDHQPDTYYANFEIVHAPSFRDDPQVWNFIDSVWHDSILNIHGLYRYRWGDSPLRYQTVHLFPQLWPHVHYMCDIHYWHGSSFPASCNYTSTPKTGWPVPSNLKLNEYRHICKQEGFNDCTE